MKRLWKRIFKEEIPFVFAGPALIWQGLFLYLPLIAVFIVSFSSSSGEIFSSLTLANYKEVLEFVYLKIILHSIILASLTAFSCLLIAYPIAYFIALKVRRFRTLFLFALILPSWTNFIVQIYAWFFLLEKGGLFSQILYRLGLTKDLINLLNSYGATLVGMVYCFLPFMIFPIYTVLEKMDKRLLEASADLGASRFDTFRKVIFPLSLPGVYAGCMLVFVPAFGEFAIPVLLGGSKKVFWGNIIVQKLLIARDWGSGFALATLGILVLVLVFITLYIILRIYKTAKYQMQYEESLDLEDADLRDYWDENG